MFYPMTRAKIRRELARATNIHSTLRTLVTFQKQVGSGGHMAADLWNGMIKYFTYRLVIHWSITGMMKYL